VRETKKGSYILGLLKKALKHHVERNKIDIGKIVIFATEPILTCKELKGNTDTLKDTHKEATYDMGRRGDEKSGGGGGGEITDVGSNMTPLSFS